MPSRIKGARFVDIEAEQKALAAEAWSPRKAIQQGGLLKYVHGGEYHAYNPDVVATLQAAVQQGDYNKFKEYTALVDKRPVSMIRDLFQAFLAEPVLLPFDYQVDDQHQQARKIADYIAGMTDRYAIREHRRIFSLDEL